MTPTHLAKLQTDSSNTELEDAGAGINVVSRVVAVLRAFAEGDDTVAIKELSERLRLAPSTLHRILDQLVAAGLIDRTKGRRYRVSGEFSRIGALAARKSGVLRLARPVIQEVARQTTETCMLGILLPQTLTMMFVDRTISPLPVPYAIRMHQPRSLLWGATGLCLLSWLNPSQVERVLRRKELSPVDGRTLLNKEMLIERLAVIRTRGYAITRGEQTCGAVGMAAPVFGADHTIVGDLCITLPQSRFSADDEVRLADLLMRRARELSRLNGHLPKSASPTRL